MKQTCITHKNGSPPPPDGRNTILIVDDLAANADLLMAALAGDYQVSVILDGQTAIDSMATVNPDLILLDIMMPRMDGYEVCARLKENPGTRDIPVIFMTALTEDADEEKGLNLGAVDFIARPFNPAIVKARVRNHLALNRARVEIARQRDQMETAYQELRKLERLRDDLVHMIVHDMRSPLTVIGCCLELVPTEQTKIPNFGKMLGDARRLTRYLCDMVAALLDVSRLEACQMPLHCQTNDLGVLTREVVARMDGLSRNRRVLVEVPDEPVLSHCDPNITGRIVQNLLDNALKFTPSDGLIRVMVVAEERWARLSIVDTGPGIPPSYHEKVFEKFGQVETRNAGERRSTGLGLTYCKLAAEAQGGGIQLESEPGCGAAFHVRLPGIARHAAANPAVCALSPALKTQ